MLRVVGSFEHIRLVISLKEGK